MSARSEVSASTAWHEPVSPENQTHTHTLTEEKSECSRNGEDQEKFLATAGKDDKENKEFLENVPVTKAYNKKYVKEHLGSYSDRRNASGHYSNDDQGRFVYKNELVSNGGYRGGRLVDLERELAEFGPGEPWPGEMWDGPAPATPRETTLKSHPEGEDCEDTRVMHDPGQPTEREIEEHRVDHMLYRSWCPHCVKGRGVGKPHRARRNEQTMPVFGFDYLHTSQKPA